MVTRRKRTSRKKPKFRSKFEQKVANRLDELGLKWTYETKSFDYTIKTPINRTRCGECGSTDLVTRRSYTPDFFLRGVPLYGGRCILEVKGRLTSADRKKMKAVVDQHPKETFIMVFQRDNFLYKGSRTRYTEWCLKNGIKALMYADLADLLE